MGPIVVRACRQAGALGGGSAAAALAKQREQEAEADQARKRFGNAKSISSAQFNSNEDSNAVDYEKQVCIPIRRHSGTPTSGTRLDINQLWHLAVTVSLCLQLQLQRCCLLAPKMSRKSFCICVNVFACRHA